jgi:hypothetical protein
MAIEASDWPAIRTAFDEAIADSLKKRDEEEAAEMERICAGRTPGDFLRVAESVRTLIDEYAMVALAGLLSDRVIPNDVDRCVELAFEIAYKAMDHRKD